MRPDTSGLTVCEARQFLGALSVRLDMTRQFLGAMSVRLHRQDQTILRSHVCETRQDQTILRSLVCETRQDQTILRSPVCEARPSMQYSPRPKLMQPLIASHKPLQLNSRLLFVAVRLGRTLSGWMDLKCSLNLVWLNDVRKGFSMNLLVQM